MAKKTTQRKTAKKPSKAKQTRKDRAMEWWLHERFGMFIHWGLYALPARHEWVKTRERITDADYQRYFDHFDPDLYDPREWARMAKAAGMRYGVITTKHHEGFCLWDTKHTDYKAPNTPCGKDLITPWVEAFRAEGLGIGFYHSLIDWHHPEYTNDGRHPMRDDETFRKEAAKRDVRKYARYLHAQIRELLTDFGRVDALFLDFSVKNATTGEMEKGREAWQSEKLVRMIRKLQPSLLINDRLDLNDVPGAWDFRTPEQFMPRECIKVDGKKVPWEACQTFSGSWGYHRDEGTWKSVRLLLVMLTETVSKGGNLLLNVGPTARGTFDDRAKERLSGLGAWMKEHSRAIYGCGEAPEGIPKPDNCLLTYNRQTNRLYIHVLEWPFKHLHLDGLAGKVRYAQLLNDASEIRVGGLHPHQLEHGAAPAEALILNLPAKQPNVTVPVIELFLK